ncbi:MAG: HpcH/HpaI aldolase/citrate lyase family protein [Alkalilacustris sp.]
MIDPSRPPRARRSLLFAPANRPEVHAKALASAADVVCLDLEDAVPPQAKEAARTLGVPFLAPAPDGPERVLRINALRSAEGLRDMLAVIEARPAGGVVLLPKVATADEVCWADMLLSEAGLSLGLAVLIETAQGVENAAAILRASPRIAFALFGGVDLAAELGVEVAHEPLLHARSRLVLAACQAGVDVLDVPALAFRDAAAVRAEADMARRLGFTGKAVIHPSNLAEVNAAFTPSPAEIARAEAVVAAWSAAPTGLVVLDGKLVEKPVIRAMQRILALRDTLARG